MLPSANSTTTRPLDNGTRAMTCCWVSLINADRKRDIRACKRSGLIAAKKPARDKLM